MEKIVKINHLRLIRLNNAEYGAFMDSFAKLIEQATIAKVGITEEERKAFKANVKKMTDANGQLKKDPNSEEINKLDQERDQLLTYFFTKIAAEMRSPDQALEAAATALGDFLVAYRGIQGKANRQETQLIKSLLLDAEQAKYTPHLQALKLNTVLAKLKTVNESYENLLDTRTNEGQATLMIVTKPLRKELDEHYEILSTKLFAVNVASPTPESEKAIADLNRLIKATKLAWRQRNGLVHLHPEDLEDEKENESEG